eukprot:865969-Prorocentrum_minimum.AAC.3
MIRVRRLDSPAQARDRAYCSLRSFANVRRKRPLDDTGSGLLINMSSSYEHSGATRRTLRAIGWTLRATRWTVRAIGWMLRATRWTLRATGWMLGLFFVFVVCAHRCRYRHRRTCENKSSGKYNIVTVRDVVPAFWGVECILAVIGTGGPVKRSNAIFVPAFVLLIPEIVIVLLPHGAVLLAHPPDGVQRANGGEQRHVRDGVRQPVRGDR